MPLKYWSEETQSVQIRFFNSIFLCHAEAEHFKKVIRNQLGRASLIMMSSDEPKLDKLLWKKLVKRLQKLVLLDVWILKHVASM